MLNKSFQTEFELLKSQGLARKVHPTDTAGIINLSSNDYLGLSKHPDVIAAAEKAVTKFGTGGTSSRLLAGTGPLHESLEKKLASFLTKEAALVFSSGYHVNTGILPALTNVEDLILYDRLCHASIIDGVRLSRCLQFSFDHNDMADLENQLKKRAAGRRRIWIVTEGFFSMDGDAPPLKDIVALAGRWGASIYLDEAHSFGVVGPKGRGWAAQEGLLDRVDVFVGTLSKTLGSQGGFVAGQRLLIDLLVSKCRSFMYTTALAPACIAAALRSLELLPSVDDRRKKISDDAEKIRVSLRQSGLDCMRSISPIIPVWTGSIEDTRRLSEHLLSHGFFVPSIRPPTVSPGEGRVRLSISYENVKEGVGKIIEAFSVYSKAGELSGQKN
jgi:8-amino-7-oxononanoate synthase